MYACMYRYDGWMCGAALLLMLIILPIFYPLSDCCWHTHTRCNVRLLGVFGALT